MSASRESEAPSKAIRFLLSADERPERAVYKELGRCPRGHLGPVGEDCAACGRLADVLDAIAGEAGG